MPLMFSENGRQQRIVPDHSVDAYLDRGWTADGDGTPDESDRKAVWVDYAEARGIDTDGMTKDEVIDAVKGGA